MNIDLTPYTTCPKCGSEYQIPDNQPAHITIESGEEVKFQVKVCTPCAETLKTRIMEMLTANHGTYGEPNLDLLRIIRKDTASARIQRRQEPLRFI